MTLHYKTKGFVFKKNDRFESDRVFTIFTNDFGKVKIYGKAIRKISSKLKGGIDIFSLSEIEFIQGKNRKTLTNALLVRRFGNIADDLLKLEISHRIGEVLNNFIIGQEKDEDIFNLINETFSTLGNCQTDDASQSVYFYFLWNFFSVLGFCPEVKKCAACRAKLNPGELFFSFKEGGVICKECSAKNKNLKKIDENAVKIIRLILEKDWNILSKLKKNQASADSLKDVSDGYYNFLSASQAFKDDF
jgi:DNA repair protein RecO (recombination protein O)